jgi:hypothetical protein
MSTGCAITAAILVLKLTTDVDYTRFTGKPSYNDWLLRPDSRKYSLYRVPYNQ